MRPFTEGIYLKYSELEHAKKISDINHKIIKECLSLMQLKTPQVEITTLADIPAGTGLGSSGSFTTALLKCLYGHRRKNITQEELAKLACEIEIEKLQEPIGKQDQYIAAFGGITKFIYKKDDSVVVEPVDIDINTIFDLEDNLLLFFTGFSRSASNILKDQNNKTKKSDKEMIDNLHFVKELGFRSLEALESSDIEKFGKIMHEHWLHKQKRSTGMSNDHIDQWYDVAMKNGAIGGKLVGAGGGGFLMFLAHDKKLLRKAMREQGLEEVRFSFDYEGAKILFNT